MPVKDAGAWLVECLDSIAAQTLDDHEVLAVDDGSRDDSRAILEARAASDPRIRVLATPAGEGGIVPALNLALAQARAPFLARMDADDRMHPRRLEVQVAALERAPSLFAVASRAVAFPQEELRDGMRDYLDWQNGLLEPWELARDRFIESPVLHPTLVARTGILRSRLGGWQDADGPEDWDLFLRAFEGGLDIARVRDVLLEWRLHQGQSTRTHPRYRGEALLGLRARYLARRLAAQPRRSVWILGAGPVGKALVKALAVAGVAAAGLADVDPRKIGGVVRVGGVGGRGSGGRAGLDAAALRWPVVAHETLRAMEPRPFAVSAVAGAPARARVRAELARWGWVEGEDFVVAA